MLSLEDMFYGPKEDVWIVKPEKKEEVKKGEPKPPPPVPTAPTALEESFGTYFPYYHPTFTAPAGAPKKPAETKKIEFKVPICCTGCVETLTTALEADKGVKTVVCDIAREKVTVTVKTDTNADDVLLQCRKEHKKSRLWTKDD